MADSNNIIPGGATSPVEETALTASVDDSGRVLRFGDLVRVVGKQAGKADNRGALGKILRSVPVSEANIDAKHLLSSHPFVYDVELILGGKLSGWQRPTLQYTTAAAEGMTGEAKRRKRKQTNLNDAYTTETNNTTNAETSKKKQTTKKPKSGVKANSFRSSGGSSSAKSTTTLSKSENSKRGIKGAGGGGGGGHDGTKGKSKRQKTVVESNTAAVVEPTSNVVEVKMFERHMRELEKCLVRLEKVDTYQYFMGNDVPPEFDECYDNDAPIPTADDNVQTSSQSTTSPTLKNAPHTNNPEPLIFPNHPPFNFVVLRKRMEKGRYILDRELMEIEDRIELIKPYYKVNKKPIPVQYKNGKKKLSGFSVFHTKGVNWDLFRMDIRGMCDQAVRRNSELVMDNGTPGSLSYSARKIKDLLDQIYEKTGLKQMAEMELSNDRRRFAEAMESSVNNEAAIQGKWKRDAFDERRYERLRNNVVCAGLSPLDEKIATYELNTSLEDSFVGLSYTYDDTGQSEGWMNTMLDDGGVANEMASAAMAALASDDGVITAQVSATMQSLLIAVQDRVMTQSGVLSQPELRSANWMCDIENGGEESVSTKQIISKAISKTSSMPEIVEQPVWGMDCYTRRNISICLETEFDADSALTFIERWLLPAINACPVDLAYNITNAACILEGRPFDTTSSLDQSTGSTLEKWRKTLLGAALMRKIQKTSPPWLASAAQLLRRAVEALGTDFFRIHPKGHGSIVLCPKIEPNRLVTFYRGEVYPSWRWGEKSDAICLIQERKGLKPRLPDFYNMALERPQSDPRGYGLLFVDASRKSGYGSMLSHSCTPSCEVRVVAVNGKLALAMTTLREMTIGDELTFDYNAVTESLHEYEGAVCLCGHGRCRGSFLHFATADCYQQVLNRNSPVAVRLAQLIKGGTKRVMAEEDDRILKRHGFQTAAFGAVSVNRRKAVDQNRQDTNLDSLDIVPIWLRTFVADVLRYIEYERRALPIALICNQLEKGTADENHAADSSSDDSSSDSETEDNHKRKRTKDDKPVKGNKPEPTFFFYCRKNREKFVSSLMKEEEHASLKGVALEKEVKKMASSAWKGLGDKTKRHWKAQALKEWEANGGKEKARLEEERLKRLDGSKNQVLSDTMPSTADNNKNKTSEKSAGKKTPKRDEFTSTRATTKISFQAADAEGVSAMEQRIQQLTQALSRVGRVLDRHREESLRKLAIMQNNDARSIDSPAELRGLAHAPLVVMEDEDVVAYLWNHPDGVAQTLLKLIKSEVCVSPEMDLALANTADKYAVLSDFGKPWEPGHLRHEPPMAGTKGREMLNAALLEFRSNILDGIVAMASDIRDHKKKKKEERESLDSTQGLVKDLLHDMVEKIVERVGDSKDALCMERKYDTLPRWLQNYNKRFKLEKAADVLLLYARTTTFFRLETYEPLQSTPIEVYARELGNAVPRSVMDAATKVENSSNMPAAGQGPLRNSSIDPADDSRGMRTTATKPSKHAVLCAPEDTVSEVVVEYQGDYVLSQLLQWYNAGIDQKPGLPDLLGCALLPSMSGSWTIDSTKVSNSATDKSTGYRSRVRPKLVEWLADPQKRGNPWPDEIRRHFIERSDDTPINNATNGLLIGSPVLDLLVSGDDSNIMDILSKMGRGARSGTSDGLLSSVDEGRPAQAVSNWVQCEKPECQKWRKVPWHVDIDMLSERFVCTDNVWNPESASCDAAEDAWDEEADAYVDVNGSVKSNVLPTIGGATSQSADQLLTSSSYKLLDFKLGARFEILKSGKKKWTPAVVVDTDFVGQQKRVKFHVPRTNVRHDEWIEVDFRRIAPLHTHIKQPQPNQSKPQRKSSISAGEAKPFTEGMEGDGSVAASEFDDFKADSERSGDESSGEQCQQPSANASPIDEDGLNDFGSDDASTESDEPMAIPPNGGKNDRAQTDRGSSSATTVTDESTPNGSPRVEKEGSNLYGGVHGGQPSRNNSAQSQSTFTIPKKRHTPPESKKPPVLSSPAPASRIPKKAPKPESPQSALLESARPQNHIQKNQGGDSNRFSGQTVPTRRILPMEPGPLPDDQNYCSQEPYKFRAGSHQLAATSSSYVASPELSYRRPKEAFNDDASRQLREAPVEHFQHCHITGSYASSISEQLRENKSLGRRGPPQYLSLAKPTLQASSCSDERGRGHHDGKHYGHSSGKEIRLGVDCDVGQRKAMPRKGYSDDARNRIYEHDVRNLQYHDPGGPLRCDERAREYKWHDRGERSSPRTDNIYRDKSDGTRGWAERERPLLHFRERAREPGRYDHSDSSPLRGHSNDYSSPRSKREHEHRSLPDERSGYDDNPRRWGYSPSRRLEDDNYHRWYDRHEDHHVEGPRQREYPRPRNDEDRNFDRRRGHLSRGEDDRYRAGGRRLDCDNDWDQRKREHQNEEPKPKPVKRQQRGYDLSHTPVL